MTVELKSQRKIDIKELPVEIPDFESSFDSKDSLIKKWIINWILSAVRNKAVKENDILPSKAEISNHLGVSIGTVQNAIRYIEDEGYLKSKQRLGTMISNVTNPSEFFKSTSKREKAITAIKKYIINNNLKPGKKIPSARKMSEEIGISQNTARLAYEFLLKDGIIESMQKRGSDSNWILKSVPFLNDYEKDYSDKIETDTLVSKITDKLKSYFMKNFEIGEKIPAHDALAKEFNVSVKTIHDCIKALTLQGILITRRGRYGTILSRKTENNLYEPLKENSIFAKATDAVSYSYQRTEEKLISHIKSNCKAGDKLPPMQKLAEMFDVSTNTIRKSLSNLEKQGYVTFGRGRFGGTFLIDIPDSDEKQSYQWISINPKYK